MSLYFLGLLLYAGAIFASSADEYPEKNVRKSSLILEYNWPEPSKSLNRLPHPRSCNLFIHTKHDGSHVVKRCHGDKVFDYRSLRCRNKSSAKCWMNIVKKGIKKVKTPFSCPFPWGLYPDKEDCTFFYECMGGKVYSRKCPDSTLFDAVERICVHSKKALCAQDSDISTKDRSTSQSLVLLETTTREKDINSEEDNSEEIGRKHRTKSENNFITSKLPFTSTSTAYPNKSLKRNEHSEEENSSEEKYNKISYELKSKAPKIRSSSHSNYSKMLTSKIASPSTEKQLTTPSLQSSDSSELPMQSTIIKSFLSTENEMKPSSIIITPEDNEKDGNVNSDTVKISFPTERMPKEFVSSVESSHDDILNPVKIIGNRKGRKINSDVNNEITKIIGPTESTSKEFTSPSEHSTLKKIDSTANNRFTPNSPLQTNNFKSKSEVTTFSFLCPDADGNFPHPETRNLFIACSGGKPTVMKCPEDHLYYPIARSCQVLFK